jgi:hypothetical protein
LANLPDELLLELKLERELSELDITPGPVVKPDSQERIAKPPEERKRDGFKYLQVFEYLRASKVVESSKVMMEKSIRQHTRVVVLIDHANEPSPEPQTHEARNKRISLPRTSICF